MSEGFPSELWTCPRIAQVIQRRYGVSYHVDHLPKLMKALGFSVQRPERQARERDEQALGNWIEKVWPSLKKRPPGSKAR
jgi:transposase